MAIVKSKKNVKNIIKKHSKKYKISKISKIRKNRNMKNKTMKWSRRRLSKQNMGMKGGALQSPVVTNVYDSFGRPNQETTIHQNKQNYERFIRGTPGGNSYLGPNQLNLESTIYVKPTPSLNYVSGRIAGPSNFGVPGFTLVNHKGTIVRKTSSNPSSNPLGPAPDTPPPQRASFVQRHPKQSSGHA